MRTGTVSDPVWWGLSLLPLIRSYGSLPDLGEFSHMLVLFSTHLKTWDLRETLCRCLELSYLYVPISLSLSLSLFLYNKNISPKWRNLPLWEWSRTWSWLRWELLLHWSSQNPYVLTAFSVFRGFFFLFKRKAADNSGNWEPQQVKRFVFPPLSEGG